MEFDLLIALLIGYVGGWATYVVSSANEKLKESIFNFFIFDKDSLLFFLLDPLIDLISFVLGIIVILLVAILSL